VLLIGIVKKNGIMMVDFALDAERHHGKSSTDAIYEACLLRFRPIMMTTMAALLAVCHSRLATASVPSCAVPRHRHGWWTPCKPSTHALYTPSSTFSSTIWRSDSRGIASLAFWRGTATCRTVMNVSTPFIHRPVATTLLTIAIAIAGGIAFKSFLSLLAASGFSDHFCECQFARSERRNYASSVATPLERQFATSPALRR